MTRVACPDGCVVEQKPDHIPKDGTPMCPVCGRLMIPVKEEEDNNDEYEKKSKGYINL